LSGRYNILLDVLERQGKTLHRLLFRLTLREDAAEDLLQDLFIKLCNHEGLARVRNPDAYVYRSAIHLAFDWRRQRRPARSLQEWQESESTDPTPLARMIEREQLQQVLEAIGRMSIPIRNAVVLRYLQQQEYEIIGQLLQKSPKQVRALCSKGLAKLRIVLSKPETAVSHEKDS